MHLRHRTAILENHLQQTVGRLSVAITPEAIHAARVAVRRLRVLLRAYRGEFDAPVAKEITSVLRHLTRDLEMAREADVRVAGLAELGKSRARRVRDASRALNARASKAYESAVSSLGTIIAGDAWRERLERLRELCTRPSLISANEESASKAQKRLLNRARLRVRRAIHHAKSRKPAKLHRVRLKVKAARYLLEDSLSKRMMRESSELKRLRKLQDCLGDYHDEEDLIKTIHLDVHNRSDRRSIRARLKERKRQHLRAYKIHSRVLLELWDRPLA